MNGDGAPTASTVEVLVRHGDIEEALAAICSVFQVRHCVYHLASRTGRDGAPLVWTTYTGAWLHRYLVRDSVGRDPTLRLGLATEEPFFWSAGGMRERDPEFFDDAARHGIGNCGFCVPLAHAQGYRAVFALNDEDRAEDFERRIRPLSALADLTALGLHDRALRQIGAATDRPSLSPREVECLSWIARGKDVASVALILQLSEHTVRDYLRCAREKLGCLTLAHAVYEATRLRLIQS